MNGDDKKQQKRAANRRSAQLSRKRKKQFIEELKEENDELRRKEQILKSIPDLIVVFDSAGRLGFVSHSVSRFIDFSPRELDGSSFWDRLCQDSVRLLKAAFMDALAARKNESDTTPLGAGVWELRLVNKDGSHKVITLNGVVHFSGDAPECVCSIRPRDESNKPHVQVKPGQQATSPLQQQQEQQEQTFPPPLKIMRPTIQPQQSVISSISSASDNNGSGNSDGSSTSTGVVHISGNGPSSQGNSNGSDGKNMDNVDRVVAAAVANAGNKALTGTHSAQQALLANGNSNNNNNNNNNNSGGNGNSNNGAGAGMNNHSNQAAAIGGNNPRRAAQISDGDTGSVVSESGSE